MALPKIGTVAYLNAEPLTQHLDPARVELVRDHPRGIAQALERGDVDAALVPVVAVLDNPEHVVVPGWCIGAEGAVDSVVLVADAPPESWTEVLLDGESRTSAVLTQLMLKAGPLAHRVRDGLRIETVAPGTASARVGGGTAALVIGDAARVLRGRHEVWIDLAEEWTAWTGLPFVFAVWAGRRRIDGDVADQIRTAGATGVAAVAGQYDGEDLVYLSERIRYALDEPALMGLRRFAALAAREGLVAHGEFALLAPVPSTRVAAGVDGSLARASRGARASVDAARAWAREARHSDLHLAARRRRAALHADPRVGYLVVVPTDAHASADHAAARYAPEIGGLAWDVAMARLRALRADSDLPIAGVSVDAVVGWAATTGRDVGDVLEDLCPLGVASMAWRVGDQPVDACLDAAKAAGVAVRAIVPIDADVDASVARLEALRAAQDRTDAVRSCTLALPLPEGALVHPGRASAAVWARWISVARLFLDNIAHLEAEWAAIGPDLALFSLEAGCDDLGLVGAPVELPDGAHWTPSLQEVERTLRASGYEPTRRDLAFGVVGGAATPYRRIRRPEERSKR